MAVADAVSLQSALARGDGNKANTTIKWRTVVRSACSDGYSGVHRWLGGDLQMGVFSGSRLHAFFFCICTADRRFGC